MIVGIGVDLLELVRIEEIKDQRRERLVQRILAGGEVDKYESLGEKRRVEYLAGRFSAKEAYAKAYGTGIGSDLSFQDLETAVDSAGRPYFLRHPFEGYCHLTISHTDSLVVAQVILEE